MLAGTYKTTVKGCALHVVGNGNLLLSPTHIDEKRLVSTCYKATQYSAFYYLYTNAGTK